MRPLKDKFSKLRIRQHSWAILPIFCENQRVVCPTKIPVFGTASQGRTTGTEMGTERD